MTEATSIFFPAADGLRLHARCYGAHSAPGVPVICLPGLARTAEDFGPLAEALANDPDTPHRVIVLDYRGRGLSEYDRDPANYTVQTELSDVLAAMSVLKCPRAFFVGTSRGGILTMLLATVAPAAIAGVVLNDIGPVIEAKGLMRIKSYIGKLPKPRNFEEGAEILRRLFGAQFPKLTHEEWLAGAYRAFRQDEKGLVPTYDVRLTSTMEGFDFDQPLPTLWKEFDALRHIPMMVVRGANSDLLSRGTVEKMLARRDALEILEIPDQGHAPLLAEPETIARIVKFINALPPAA